LAEDWRSVSARLKSGRRFWFFAIVTTVEKGLIMSKSTPVKTAKPKTSPDTLSKTGGKAGIQLTETQLGQASGGFGSGGGTGLKIKLDS
jgi:hypothetical protein